MSAAPRFRRRILTGLLVAYALLLAASHGRQLATRTDDPPLPSLQLEQRKVPRQSAQGPVAGAPIRIAFRDWDVWSPPNGAAASPDRPVVLMLHGSPGQSSDMGRLQAALAPHFRTLAIDLPGFGRSSRDLPDYSIAAHARYVLALMDSLGVDRAAIFAHSMGSGVAFHMAELAPQRVVALAVYGGIGIQEGEGSGDYLIEHVKYALGFPLVVWLPEFIPHFGVLGGHSLRRSFIRNFWDTDQRPLKPLLERLLTPTLILHGRHDPLVPLWTAEQHHRLIRGSRLVVYDNSHFMVFSESGAKTLAADVTPFFADAFDGRWIPEPHMRLTAPPESSAPLPGGLTIRREQGPWLQLGALAAATLISEDLTCIAAGLLIRRAGMDFFVGVLGCFVGIYLGDLGLWLIGRFVGRPALQWSRVRRRLPVHHLERLGDWFDRRGAWAILASRFLPGTRLPMYVAAGAVGRRATGFVVWTFVAALLWTPLVVLGVAIFGETAVRPLERWFGHGWFLLAAGSVLLLIAMRIAVRCASEFGRARLAASISRLWRWEFWPMWIFYAPLVPWIAWLALRHRGLTLPTASNPAIPHGGFVGESKYDILMRLPRRWIVPTELIPPGLPDDRLARVRALLAAPPWTYPLILKPDAAQRGAGLRLVRDESSLGSALQELPAALIAQTYHPGPYEAGIFYYRLPDQRRGCIFSITDKVFPFVIGDGAATLEQLIWRHPRYRMQAATFLARLEERACNVPAAGEHVRLAVAGNHCQGTLFRDGGHLITPALEQAVNEIVGPFEGFYFGRFDVRYADADALKAGRDFAVIELNGATSESTNIYDPDRSLLWAYRTLLRQWAVLYQIGDANRGRGARVTPLMELIRATRQYYRDRRIDPLAD